jgi:hypothetical protein
MEPYSADHHATTPARASRDRDIDLTMSQVASQARCWSGQALRGTSRSARKSTGGVGPRERVVNVSYGWRAGVEVLSAVVVTIFGGVSERATTWFSAPRLSLPAPVGL